MLLLFPHGELRADETLRSLLDINFERLVNTEVMPIDVLGSHIHLKGEWMLGYRYRVMSMEGNRDGARRQADAEVLQSFTVAPTAMTKEMHLVEIMYGFTDDLTIMALLPYKRLSMEHLTGTGVRFTTESRGFGDLALMAHYSIWRRPPHRLIILGSVRLPTGSITKRDDTPTAVNAKQPYPMQLGTGTMDLQPGLTYIGQTKDWAWGGHAMATVGAGRNSEDYRVGNRYRMAAWGGYRITDWISPSLGATMQFWERYSGADSELNPALVPTADPSRRGGRRLDVKVGLNLFATKGAMRGHRLSAEFGFPIYQHLSGPQLETDWILTAGWTWRF
ncbi:MAG: hypothetical protein COB53_12580 [Elusimicrobia bacterium]|nr:MAG: hypothetical protein COB53_12580 [Elusimicrobiota bacterium]